MRWVMIAVFLNPWGGGIAVQQIPMPTRDACASAATTLSQGVQGATGWGVKVLQSVVCVEAADGAETAAKQ